MIPHILETNTATNTQHFTAFPPPTTTTKALSIHMKSRGRQQRKALSWHVPQNSTCPPSANDLTLKLIKPQRLQKEVQSRTHFKGTLVQGLAQVDPQKRKCAITQKIHCNQYGGKLLTKQTNKPQSVNNTLNTISHTATT